MKKLASFLLRFPVSATSDPLGCIVVLLGRRAREGAKNPQIANVECCVGWKISLSLPTPAI